MDGCKEQKHSYDMPWLSVTNPSTFSTAPAASIEAISISRRASPVGSNFTRLGNRRLAPRMTFNGNHCRAHAQSVAEALRPVRLVKPIESPSPACIAWSVSYRLRASLSLLCRLLSKKGDACADDYEVRGDEWNIDKGRMAPRDPDRIRNHS